VRLLRVGLLALLTVGLLAVAVMHGYSEDQGVIRWFPGTGIAGKIDVMGTMPSTVLIEDQKSHRLLAMDLAADGTFVARLAPGDYRLQLQGDSRSVLVSVPSGHCVDLVLDFRLPTVVLEIPGEGWPVPTGQGAGGPAEGFGDPGGPSRRQGWPG
jgi:hypothetical protein